MSRCSEEKVDWGRSFPDVTGSLGGATKRCCSTFQGLCKCKVDVIAKPCREEEV